MTKSNGYLIDLLDGFERFFVQIIEGIYNILMSNRFVFVCFFVPIAVSVAYIIIDFIFDVRDSVSYSERTHDYVSKIKGFVNYKCYKDNRTDMDKVFEKSKANADYKHNLRMKELEYFRESESLRHSHKTEEQNNFIKNYNQIRLSNPTTKYGSHSLGKRTKNVDLNIEVED